MSKLAAICLSLFLLISSCNEKKDAGESEIKDKKSLAGVFSILEGRWDGTFYIYADTSDRQSLPPMPREISDAYFYSLPLKLIDSVNTVHNYRSENPFRQTGKITDKYIDKSGSLRTVISQAVNYVENGKLKCIVKKPDEDVIHNGEIISPNTFLWYRNIKYPRKIEFFRETADSQNYKIIGWGYYGNDDTTLSPRNWFFANYTKTVQF